MSHSASLVQAWEAWMDAFGNTTVSLLSPPVASGVGGHPSGEWTTTASDIAAAVQVLGGAEQPYADSQVAVVTHRVVIAWRAGVTAKMRVQYGSRVLRIWSALDVGAAGVAIELMCSEVS